MMHVVFRKASPTVAVAAGSRSGLLLFSIHLTYSMVSGRMLKAAAINIFISTMGHIVTMCDVEGMAGGEKPTESDHMTVQCSSMS